MPLHQGGEHLGEWSPVLPDGPAEGGPAACDCRKVLDKLAECRTALAALSREERLAVLSALASEIGLSVMPGQSDDLGDRAGLVSAGQLNWARDFVSQVVLSDALIGAALQLDESKQEIDGIAERLAHVAEHPLGQPEGRWANYGRLFERTAAGMFTCDADGRFLDANGVVLRLLGCRTKDQLSPAHTFASLLADAGTWHAVNTALHTDHVVQGVECELVRHDGAHVRVLLTAAVVHGRDGTPVGFEGVWIEMTERQRHAGHLTETQRLEAAQRAIRALKSETAGPLEALCEASGLLLRRCEAEGRDVELALVVSDEAAKLAEALMAAGGPGTPSALDSPGPSSA